MSWEFEGTDTNTWRLIALKDTSAYQRAEWLRAHLHLKARKGLLSQPEQIILDELEARATTHVAGTAVVVGGDEQPAGVDVALQVVGEGDAGAQMVAAALVAPGPGTAVTAGEHDALEKLNAAYTLQARLAIPTVQIQPMVFNAGETQAVLADIRRLIDQL